MKTKKLSLTVGITTCYGNSILDTVKSIRASKGVDKFRFIIIADRVPIKPEIKKELKKYQVELIENRVPAGQIRKQKQILKMCKSDIIVFTQDDVLFAPTTLVAVLERFQKHPKTTFISIKKQPLGATSFFEDVITVGTNVVNRYVKEWNSGDNYLSAIGRFMAFRTEWIKKFKIPDEVVSSDSFHYFENRRLGGVYEYLSEVVFFYRKPQNLKEHLRKSTRFQLQRVEMSKYFGDLGNEYRKPKLLFLKSIIPEFFASPIKFSLFLAVYLYTRVFKINMSKALTPMWEVDISTKKIKA